MSSLEFVSLLPSYILHFSAQVCTEVKPAVAKIAADFIHQEISWQNLLRNPSFSAIKAACVVLKQSCSYFFNVVFYFPFTLGYPALWLTFINLREPEAQESNRKKQLKNFSIVKKIWLCLQKVTLLVENTVANVVFVKISKIIIKCRRPFSNGSSTLYSQLLNVYMLSCFSK